ncbi:MAG: antitoxin [Fimbriimonas sp.]
MRTTLDIADDVLHAAKVLGRREKKSLGLVISDLARKALLLRDDNSSEAPEEFFGFKPLGSRGVVVTSELIEKLREDEFS